MPDKPIRPLVLVRHIEAAAECPAGSQDPETFPISGFLIRECVKAVQRQNDVEFTVCKGKRTYIPLLKGYILQVQSIRLFLCLPHHIGRVIQTGNIRFRQRPVKRHGQNSGSHRHLQQFAGEMFRDTGQRIFQIGIAFRLIHIPNQAAHRFSAQGRAGDHAIIKIVAACQPIGAANRFFSLHVHSSCTISPLFSP